MNLIYKITCYLGSIVNFLISISLAIYMYLTNDQVGYILGTVFLLYSILTILILVLLIKSINENKKKIIIGVLGILFGFILSGISYFMYFLSNKNIHNMKNSKEEIKNLYNEETDLNKLVKLRNLYDKGIISKEEYEEKRARLINNI